MNKIFGKLNRKNVEKLTNLHKGVKVVRMEI